MARVIGGELVRRVTLWTAVCASAVVVGLPAVEPAVASGAAGIAVGFVVGAALFAALARRAVALRVGCARRSLARSAYLAGRASYEEVLWRGIACGGLTQVLGMGGALAVSTIAFAAAHFAAQGREASVHLVTGATFGVVFLALGLGGAIAAHVAYNVLIGQGNDAAQARASPSSAKVGAL